MTGTATATPVDEGDSEDVLATSEIVMVDAQQASLAVGDVGITMEPSGSQAHSTVVVPSAPSEQPREGVHGLVRQSSQLLQRIRPHAVRLSGVFGRRSLQRNVLCTNALPLDSDSHLKLGNFHAKEVSTLVVITRLFVFAGPALQVVWTIFIEPDRPSATAKSLISVSMSDRGEATIQLLVLVGGCLFIRQTLVDRKRQPLQQALAHLAACVAVLSGMTFTADVLKSYRPTAVHGRRLLSFANAFLVNFLYLTISYLTDHFAETILASREAFQHVRQERLLLRSRRLGFALNILCGFYLAVRLALTWRSDVVFDFIPMTNMITPIRITYLEHKDMAARHVFVDTFVLTGFDLVLLVLSCVKCHFTRRLYSHIFISDFARRYTEFCVFVVNFRNTLVMITVGGHVATWVVPFYHTMDTADLDNQKLPILDVGSVQMQVGFRFSLALSLLTAMVCALPSDVHWQRSCLGKSRKSNVKDDRVKYYLFQADVLQKTAYRNLQHVGHVVANEFVLENHIQAFNFAQLVYARGNRNYDQELESLQLLVGDPNFTILEVVHDAKTDTHCLILASDDRIVVTFRGTSSKKNARTDLQSVMALHLTAKQLDLTKIPSIRPRALSTNVADNARTMWHQLVCKRHDPYVHSGFYAAYMSVADCVLDRVKSLYESDQRPILVTGHSLGGALAVLCAFDLVARQRISNVACTTFGCPRLGNHAFQKRYACVVPATFAFVNASDMITKLPPKTPKAQSYASVGQLVLINSFGNLLIEPNKLELAHMHRGYSTKAHTMRAYQLSLLRWCLRSHTTYHPQFWRQSLTFLQAEYGHLPDVREYLNNAMALNPRMCMSFSSQTLRAGSTSPTKLPTVTQAQLRMIARRLESALQEERENREDEAFTLSFIAQFRQWVAHTDTREWFSTNDALRLLMSQLQLERIAIAMNLAQLLTVQGLVKPERVVFGRNARFYFPVRYHDDEEEETGEGITES